MTEEKRKEIVRYCESHPDESWTLIAGLFGISEKQAYEIYLESLLGF